MLGIYVCMLDMPSCVHTYFCLSHTSRYFVVYKNTYGFFRPPGDNNYTYILTVNLKHV